MQTTDGGRVPLIDTLAGLQQANNWTDGQMAAKLGIGRPMWRFLRCGLRQPGVETLRGIALAFPSLASAVRAYVAPVARGEQA
ncbi:MAG TPA: helix-turn-helix transcriptional regulator [Chloroflexota bacterium]|nr:helix-turn-helix transcriptional regulator [Chloroflexota bacterium]